MGAELEDPISQVANIELNGRAQIRMLEAGCGSSSHIKLHSTVYAVGIDISKAQLDKNTVVQEKILGDIQTYPLPPESFDVVVCWMVIEHLPNPEAAVLNMFKTVKPGGLVLLGFPHLLSLKGLATKITPYWLHKAYYRLLKYEKNPFPTYMRKTILPKNLTCIAENNGFSVLEYVIVEGSQSRRLKQMFLPLYWALMLATGIVWVLSFGKMNMMLDNCALALKKTAPSTTDVNTLQAAQA